MLRRHAYQPFLILKGEFHNLKVGDWGLKGEIFSAMNLTVEMFTIERNLDNYAGIHVQYFQYLIYINNILIYRHTFEWKTRVPME